MWGKMLVPFDCSISVILRKSLQRATDLFVNTWQRQSSKSKALVRGKQWWRGSAEVNSSVQGWRFARTYQLLGNEASVLSQPLQKKWEVPLLLLTEELLDALDAQNNGIFFTDGHSVAKLSFRKSVLVFLLIPT